PLRRREGGRAEGDRITGAGLPNGDAPRPGGPERDGRTAGAAAEDARLARPRRAAPGVALRLARERPDDTGRGPTRQAAATAAREVAFGRPRRRLPPVRFAGDSPAVAEEYEGGPVEGVAGVPVPQDRQLRQAKRLGLRRAAV